MTGGRTSNYRVHHLTTFLGSFPSSLCLGAMGAGQSSSQAHPPLRGLHVLRVTPSSPASLSNIEPFFDFVVGFEGDSLSAENNIDAFALEKIVESHENRILNLLVWNSKNQRTRGMVRISVNTYTIAFYTFTSCSNNAIAHMVATTFDS